MTRRPTSGTGDWREKVAHPLWQRFSGTNALRSVLARKWRMARRVLQSEGLWVLVWEIFCQGLKPLLKVYESLAWLWSRASGCLCFKEIGRASCRERV